ncbi:aldehyde dehydrogenase family protein [Leptospira koniambonensis]|uniref:aldehyde dehydrogenase (NAD(+)) n=1 Tax=Leptospira koniambonensis TaxID=2484950 RepID=A0A4R9JE36_9LEPT|nr:aldehyde dehydrogenase family protein [Leptospira koniambonensis]TGL36816.1 aldehyde dehydrogenase family protein [Leptospira koniambonensis]
MKIITTHYIDGKFIESKGKETLDLISPINKKVIGRVTLGNREDVSLAVNAAKVSFLNWSMTTIEERKKYLQAIYESLQSRRKDHIDAIMEEYAGRTLAGAAASVDAAIQTYKTVQQLIDKVPFSRNFGEAEIVLRPIGVAALITPWNADLFNTAIKIAPALAAGCTVVVKPSELSAIQTNVMLECIDKAGLPSGVINVVNGLGEVVGQEMITHPFVDKISFTGSTIVGKHILRAAVDTMKRVTLELGGKSATILLDDADLEEAIPFSLRAAFMNNGQACIAGTRLLIPESRAEEIKSMLKKAALNIKVGNPSESDTVIGPLVSEKQWIRVQNYIKKGIDEGAEVLIGGLGSPDGLEDGYFTKPTIFVNVKNSMQIAQEEIFGPVLSVITYESEEEAIKISNDSPYGLFAWISGKDKSRAKRVAERIEAGGVMINEFKNVAAYPEIPAGGMKQSGIGRELGVYGIEEYLQTQSIYG